MDSSCCLNCPVAAFYLITGKKQKGVKQERIARPMKPFATASLKHQTEKDLEDNFCVRILLNYKAIQLSNIKCVQYIYRHKREREYVRIDIAIA